MATSVACISATAAVSAFAWVEVEKPQPVATLDVVETATVVAIVVWLAAVAR